jgi:hypothetical protein
MRQTDKQFAQYLVNQLGPDLDELFSLTLAAADVIRAGNIITKTLPDAGNARAARGFMRTLVTDGDLDEHMSADEAREALLKLGRILGVLR